jgi:Ni,Fe-hydrogenase I cytochrome b subunit
MVLSLVQPGVGHLYAGSLKGAAIAFGGVMLLNAVIRLFLLGSLALLVVAILLALFVRIAIAWDAGRYARTAETSNLHWFQGWYVYTHSDPHRRLRRNPHASACY